MMKLLEPKFICLVYDNKQHFVMGRCLLLAMLVAATLVTLNLLVDLTYAWLDPRIRYQ